MGIIYLIQPFEFINTNIYKIGCSKNENMSRIIKGYKSGSTVHCVFKCNEHFKLEKIIINEFKIKFKLAQGREYFEGNFTEIYKIFFDITFNYNYKNIKNKENKNIKNKENKNIKNKENKNIKNKENKENTEDKSINNKENKNIISKDNKNIINKDNFNEYNFKDNGIKNNIINLNNNYYKCESCGVEYKYKSQYERHVNRKSICSSDTNKKGRPFSKLKKPVITNNSISKSIKPSNSIIISCDYCKSKFQKKYLYTHIIKVCLHVPNKIKENYIRRHNKNKHTKEENKISISSFKRGNGINNANFINVNNINDFDNDDYSHLTKDDMLKICNSGFNSYKLLMELLQENKNNINFMVKNKNKNNVHVIKNNKVKVISKVEFKEGKLNRIIYVLGEIFIKDKIISQLSEKEKLIFKNVLNLNKNKDELKYYQYADEIYTHVEIVNERNKNAFLDSNLIN